jgi:hypothetical protein
MDVEDLFEAEVGLAVAATAAVFSPRTRKIMRRGAVYALAGALKAGDAVAATARGARGEAEEEPAAPAEEAKPPAAAAKPPAEKPKPAARRAPAARPRGATAKAPS